ncbi:MAG: protein-L-isoaspartate(D-aspartate) O-methyltransferase, partial [Terrimicrobiaceae bacterium]|nr:protein-L-isoaspartate(D-aspartate) O-methyltransferase [Terrimicrobiaceae bacterium]
MSIAAWLALPAAMVSAVCRLGAGEYSAERREMVAAQLRGRGIEEARVLAAMEKVPRHEFVPPGMRHEAYRDRPLPIGFGQTISQPYIVGLMTGLLEIDANSRVLEIGTGSGYQAAVLAELVSDVHTIELVPELAKQAAETLERLGYRNVHAKVGDGYLGWPEEAPFDAIIVTCAPDDVPPKLVEQLREGGRLVIPVGDMAGGQELCVLE